MGETAERRATYEDLYTIPEHMTGEIIDGRLIATPRPSIRHVRTASVVAARIMGTYDFTEGGGPGGWLFLVEPEIGLGDHTLVPDLAGWKKERFPYGEETNWISVPPDWVCEVLSPRTVRTDKTLKMPIYARFGVPYLWLIDPIAKTLDVFGLQADRWVVLGLYGEGDVAQAEPFPSLSMDLNSLWLD